MEPAGKQEKTKYKLAASMKECMKQMPVDKITVKNIVEGCGVARQTFYRNFLDKYDLINWYFDKLVLQSFEQIGMGHTENKDELEKATKVFQFYQDLIGRKTSRPLGEDLQFLLEMYCRGSVYMTVKWVLTGMKDSPAKMSKKLVEAMPPRLAAVFDELKLL